MRDTPTAGTSLSWRSSSLTVRSRQDDIPGHRTTPNDTRQLMRSGSCIGWRVSPVRASQSLRPSSVAGSPGLPLGQMRFLVLGPLEVMDDGDQPVQIAGAKERMILAHLIANADRVVPTDDLIDELWGENPPRTAERTLRSYVSRLRHFLDPDRSTEVATEILRSRGDGYELIADGHQIDAVRFEQLTGEGHRLIEEGNPEEADL